MDRMIEAGFGPDDVTAVGRTHLHVDRVGWNTHLVGDEWVPSFPKATLFILAVGSLASGASGLRRCGRGQYPTLY